MVLVDSSVWIEGLRKTGALEVKCGIEGLLEEYEAQWCTPVRLEVIGGVRKQERQRLGRYFSVVPYTSATEAHWHAALSLSWNMRDKGQPVPWMDLLIAAIAIEEDLRLYTLDAHFSMIAQHAPLRLYAPGYGGRFQADENS